MKKEKSLEKEFEEHYWRFHHYMDKSKALYNLYFGEHNIRTLKNNYNAVPTLNDCLIKLLEIKDKRILEVFNEWKDPRKTAELAREIEKKFIGGHLTADITYTFWKYADLASILKESADSMNNKVLLEQAIVTACTAYECFLKEMIPWILKNNKKVAKRFLGGIDKPIKTLGKYDFDVLGNSDKLYLEFYADKLFPLFPDVYKFYKEIFGINPFYSEREKGYVELIFQVRHCIVHNEGKPDKKWLQKTRKKKLTINNITTKKYCIKLHEKLHDIAYQIFMYMKLDPSKAPWKPSKAGSAKKKDGMYLKKGKWKYIEKKISLTSAPRLE